MPQAAFRAVRSRRKFMKAPTVKRKLGAFIDNDVKPHFVSEFDEKVSDWSGKPIFQARKFITSDYIKIHVFPEGEHKDKWIWVSRGTEDHYVPKSGPALLAFTVGYSPRTKPRGQAHVGTGKATGDSVVVFSRHEVSGIEAREFEEVIAEDNKDWYSRTMENAWGRIIRSL